MPKRRDTSLASRNSSRSPNFNRLTKVTTPRGIIKTTGLNKKATITQAELKLKYRTTVPKTTSTMR